jgi:hypothetical protein
MVSGDQRNDNRGNNRLRHICTKTFSQKTWEDKDMNVEEKFSYMQRWVNGRSIKDLFDEFQMRNLRYAAHPPGTCVYCGGYMSPQEQKPAGAITKRAMHDACFAHLRQHSFGRCIVCGYNIDDPSQVQGQRNGAADIHHWVHQQKVFDDWKPCLDFFVLVSIHGLGIPSGIAESERWFTGRPPEIPERRQQQNQRRQQYVDQAAQQEQSGDVVDAEYWVNEQKSLPTPHKRGRLVPPTPEEQKMIEHLEQESFFRFKKPEKEFVYVEVNGDKKRGRRWR